MPLDPTTEEWELAFIDRITNYFLDDQAGGIVRSRENVELAMACLLLEATHVEMGNTVRFVFRISRATLNQLRVIVDQMCDDMDMPPGEPTGSPETG
jgi:hypothetical protein